MKQFQKNQPGNRKSALSRSGRILPREQGALSLDIVIGVMAFLASVSLGGVLIAHRSAETWQAGIAGRLTVQIMPVDDTPPQTEVDAAIGILRDTPGIIRAAALSDADNLALVEPWLGRDAIIAALPFPRLIDAQIAPGATPDMAALQRRILAAAPHAIFDDHGRWAARLKTLASTLIWSASAILALIALATAAAVAFATRAGLAAHREIVDLLHLMGARDQFISRAFEWHYLTAAGVASILGLLPAASAFLALGSIDPLVLGGFSFLPPIGLAVDELPWLLTVPVGASFIAWATARISVLAALRESY